MPIEPNKYKLHKKVTPVALLKQRFIYRNGTYRFKKTLYDTIYVEIEVDIREKWMTYFVKSQNGDSYYTPFYLPEERDKYLAYEDVVHSFNQCMDKLCEAKVLWRPDFNTETNNKTNKKQGYKNTLIKRKKRWPTK